MKLLKLLVVDDDESQIQLLLDQIKEKNRDLLVDQIEIVAETCNNKDDAIFKITSMNYNVAIVDLKLSNDNTKTDGNDVIKEIKNKMRFPIIVLSNFPQSLDPELAVETDVFRIK
jgi:CheY-like chemotaxis protein